MRQLILSQKHKRRFGAYVDTLVYAGGIVGPIITLPQLLKIFIEHTAAGVSLFSWVCYLTGSVVYLAYGWAHREKPIIFLNALNLPIYALIVLGILIYG